MRSERLQDVRRAPCRVARAAALGRAPKELTPQVYPYGRVGAPGGDAGTLVEGHDLRGTQALLQAVACRPGAFVSLDARAAAKAV
jgi:hypothetical protein